MHIRFTSWCSLVGRALALAVFLVVLLVPVTAVANPKVKLEVCHIPSSQNVFQTILVSPGAFEEHLGHGDVPESCNEYCEEFCDDGDACTVDDADDCEGQGCPVLRDPVDCDDGNVCTYDTCDPVLGCVNAPDLAKEGQACDEGKICDAGGACVPEEPAAECPCFDEQTLLDELNVNGGALAECADYDEEDRQYFPALSDGSYILYQNFSLACSGVGGLNCTTLGLGCGFATGYDSAIPGWSSAIVLPVTPEEDTACRGLIQSVCSAAGSSSTESARVTAPDGPSAAVPAMIDGN